MGITRLLFCSRKREALISVQTTAYGAKEPIKRRSREPPIWCTADHADAAATGEEMPKADFSRYLGISAMRGREHVEGCITRSAETHRQRAARYRMEALC